MIKKLLAVFLFGTLLFSPVTFSNAAWNSWLAENPSYRPIHYSQYKESYVDLTSITTKKNTSKQWVFAVNQFTSREDSGIIGNTMTVYYKVNKGTNDAWVNYGSGWTYIPMNEYPSHAQQGAYNTINYCYAYMFGYYFNDYNGATSKWGAKTYKG